MSESDGSYKLDLWDLQHGDPKKSSFQKYIDAIARQILISDSRAFFISCLLSAMESSENLSHDEVFIHVLVDLVGEGVKQDRMQPQKRVDVKEISLKYLHNDLEKEVGCERAEKIRKFRKDGERRDFAAFGLTIEFKAHYPKNKVSFGVHAEFLIKNKILSDVSKAPESEESSQLSSRLSEGDPPLWKARIFTGLGDSVKRWEETTKIHEGVNPNKSPDWSRLFEQIISESTNRSKSVGYKEPPSSHLSPSKSSSPSAGWLELNRVLEMSKKRKL